MKKILGIVTLLVLSCSAFAQNDYNGSGAFSYVFNGDGWLRPGGGSNDNPSKGIFKIRLDGLPALKIGLGYERVLTDKITFSVDGLYQVPTTNSGDFLDLDLLYDQVVSGAPGLGDTISALFPSGNFGLEGAEVSRYYIMPEVRFYYGNAPRGFYSGLFFKYRAYDYGNKFLYTDSPSATFYNYDVNVEMNTASIGLSLGFQTFLTKTISLDVLLFGLQYSSNIGSIKINATTGSPITQGIQSNTSAAVDFINTELPVASDLLRIVEINNDIINLESRFNSPSIRLPSIRLGIRL